LAHARKAIKLPHAVPRSFIADMGAFFAAKDSSETATRQPWLLNQHHDPREAKAYRREGNVRADDGPRIKPAFISLQ